MKRMVILTALVVARFTFLSDSVCWAVEPHQAEALKHAQAAIQEGKAKKPSSFVEHAQEALKHAEAAQAQNPNPHMLTAVDELKYAVRRGQVGMNDLAIQHAEEAVKRIDMIK
jgi:hypothetical protein